MIILPYWHWNVFFIELKNNLMMFSNIFFNIWFQIKHTMPYVSYCVTITDIIVCKCYVCTCIHKEKQLFMTKSYLMVLLLVSQLLQIFMALHWRHLYPSLSYFTLLQSIIKKWEWRDVSRNILLCYGLKKNAIMWLNN